MARVVVTGGAGFVGSNLVRLLLESEPREVLVVDNLLSAERENLPADERVRLIEASINDDDVLAGLPEDLARKVFLDNCTNLSGTAVINAHQLTVNSNNTASNRRANRGP